MLADHANLSMSATLLYALVLLCWSSFVVSTRNRFFFFFTMTIPLESLWAYVGSQPGVNEQHKVVLKDPEERSVRQEITTVAATHSWNGPEELFVKHFRRLPTK